MLGIGEMYRCSHKITPYGIEGYQVERKYEQTQKILKEKNDPNANKEDVKKRETKRGHYLEDYAKVHGDNPGPGDYNCPNDNWKKSSHLSKKKIKPSKKLTYIDEIMQREKKEKMPAPGQYKLFKNDKELLAEKKRLANRKVSHSERFTYLDAVQYEASITPGVGSYNTTIVRPRSATMLGGRQKNIGMSRPASGFKKREKQPCIGTYNPKLEEHKSFSRKTKGYHEWGQVDRFRSEKESALGPGTYLQVDDNKIIGRKSAKSVYYG